MLVGLTSQFSSALPLATDCGLKPFFVLLTDTGKWLVPASDPDLWISTASSSDALCFLFLSTVNIYTAQCVLYTIIFSQSRFASF